MRRATTTIAEGTGRLLYFDTYSRGGSTTHLLVEGTGVSLCGQPHGCECDTYDPADRETVCGRCVQFLASLVESVPWSRSGGVPVLGPPKTP